MRHKHASLPSTASTAAQGDSLKKATFGAGCFWGPELHFQRIPGVVRPLQALASFVGSSCVGLYNGDQLPVNDSWPVAHGWDVSLPTQVC